MLCSSGVRKWMFAGAGLLLASGLLMGCLQGRSVSSEAGDATHVAGAAPRPVNAGPSAPAGGSEAGRPALRATGDIRVESGAAALLARGADLYARNCAACHGDRGCGQGLFASLQNPRPRGFGVEPFKLYTTQNQIPSDDDLLRTLRRGMPGSAMPPWDHLPESDLRALVKYVRVLERGGIERELQELVDEGVLSEEGVPAEVARRTEPGPALVVPPEPAFDDLAWFKGRQSYVQNCAACHGPDGHPVLEAVMADPQGYPVPPRSFVHGIFKGGSEGEQLYARIRAGMRGTPMPESDAEAIPDEEMWSLIHYVQSLAQPGSQERAEIRMGTIRAVAASGSLPESPTSPEWDRAPAAYVALTPLWWSEERIANATVQAMHDGSRIAFRLTWLDETPNLRAVGQHEFRDGVAIQFSNAEEPPFYMGDASGDGDVHVWFWKADREHDLAEGRQDVADLFPNLAVDRYDPFPNGRQEDLPDPAESLKPFRAYLAAWAAGNVVADPELSTPVESLVARGPGTLYARPEAPQAVAGQGMHQRGTWYVQMQRDLKPDAGEQHPLVFERGETMYAAVAVWDGGAGDRAGKKNFSMWQKLVLE